MKELQKKLNQRISEKGLAEHRAGNHLVFLAMFRCIQSENFGYNNERSFQQKAPNKKTSKSAYRLYPILNRGFAIASFQTVDDLLFEVYGL